MEILITGGLGFIGLNTALALNKNGHKVSILDNMSSNISNRQPLTSVLQLGIKIYNCDITKNINDIEEKIFYKNNFDVVYHFAAQVNVRKSTIDPVLDANTNIIGTINIIELCNKYKVKKLIFSSSGGCVYGELANINGNKEGDIKNPICTYGLSKLTCENYIKMLCKRYNITYIILRYANVYGNEQDPASEAGVISIFIENAIKNKTLTIFGNGEQTRDFIHVIDVVAANESMLQINSDSIFNIGTGIKTSIKEIIKEIKKYFINLEIINIESKKEEIINSYLDISLIKQTGWSPKIKFEDGIRDVIKYLQNKNSFNL